MSRRILVSVGLTALLLSTLPAASGSAAPLSDPPVFTSQRGALDLVMVAGAVPTTITSGVSTSAWVYEVCARTNLMQNACPSGSAHPLGLEDNVLIVKGAVPGPNGGYVLVKRAKR